MPVTVQPLLYEDLPTYIAIVQRTFKSGLGAVLLDGPLPTPEQVTKHLKSTQQTYHSAANQFCKAVDSATGAIMGVAKWQFFPQEQTPAQLEETLRKTGPGDESYVALHAPAKDYLLDSRREYTGTSPYIYLSVLTIDPAYQGKGAGRALVEWGTAQADELGLPTYLEASVEGYPLYERCGFQVVREARFDMGRLGRKDIPAADLSRVMIRPARKDGQETGVVDWKAGREYHWEPKYA